MPALNGTEQVRALETASLTDEMIHVSPLRIRAAEEFIPKKCDLAKTVELLRVGLELTRPLAEMPDDEQAEKSSMFW